MIKIEYQYKNGVSVLDSCDTCTGIDLIIEDNNFELCGQKYFELRITSVAYDDSGNQIIYFNYDGDTYGTTMTFNDFMTAIKPAFNCPPDSQCVNQFTEFNWQVNPLMGDKYVSTGIVRPVGTPIDYTYSFVTLTINATPYVLGSIWDDSVQGKACDNTKDYIDAIINYIASLSIPEFMGAVNLADNGMTDNFNGDNLLELYFTTGTSVVIQIQDSGSNVGTFNFAGSVITEALLSVTDLSVVDTGDLIIQETLEVTDGESFRSTDNITIPLSVYSVYGYEYNFNLDKALVVSFCIDTQSECVLNNFAQIIITPTQMQTVLAGGSISGGSGNTNTAPVNTLVPYIFGLATDGGILTTTNGLWVGNPTPTYAYDWESSSDGGLTWNPYSPPENNINYTAQTSDVGNLVRCKVTATNIVSSAFAYSNSVLITTGGSCVPQVITAPSISGTTGVGNVLTTTNGTWSGSPTGYAYQWYKNGVQIFGEIANTYTSVSGDEGQNIQCRVEAINLISSSFAYSNVIVPTLAPSNVVAPIVYGDCSVGGVLNVYEGEWDGYPIPLYSYNWQYSSDGGATWNNYSPVEISNTYVVASGDVGNLIRCQVDGTNTEGASSADSNDFIIPSVSVPVAPTFVVNPVVNVLGTNPVADVYLEVTDGLCNGTSPISFSYQWKNNGVDILGEINSTYKILSTDFGDTITCEVTATNGVLPDATFTAGGIVVEQKPINIVAPVVSGVNQVGNVLTTTDGTWTGSPTITYAYQWYRDCDAIIGANSSTYTSTSFDARKVITCKVTASNSYGNGDATSNGITIESAPSNIQPPVIYGSWAVGSTLTVQDGYYDGYPTPSITREWQYSSDGGTTWNNYSPSESGTTYTIVSGDVGNLIRVYETATNSVASVSTASNNASITASVVQRPQISVAPVVSGNDWVGETLTTTDGTWTGSPTNYDYQWLRNGTTPIGTNTDTYTLTSADVDAEISCIVTATNSGGSQEQISNEVYVFDADFQTLKAQATSSSYALPSTAQQKHFNKMLTELKAGGFFQLMDVFYWFANNGSAGFGRLNWVTPASFECTAVNAPSWVSNSGYSFNSASSQYLDTNFNPATSGVNYAQNNAGRYAYAERTNSTNNQRIDGNNLGLSDNCMIISASNNANTINSGTTLPTTSAATNQTNLHSIIRTSSTAVTRYYDLNVAINATSSGVPNSNQWLGRSLTTYSSYRIRFYAMGGAISSGNYPSFKAIIDKYMNSLP